MPLLLWNSSFYQEAMGKEELWRNFQEIKEVKETLRLQRAVKNTLMAIYYSLYTEFFPVNKRNINQRGTQEKVEKFPNSHQFLLPNVDENSSEDV